MHQVIRPLIENEIRERIGCFDKLIVIDQNPIGHTVRSDVGTYTNLLPILREFYATLALARMKGLEAKNFSYNHRKGMCGSCYGMGYKKVSMLFLPAVHIVCEECRGLRLNPISLSVEYLGKNFGQQLLTTVDEAYTQFAMIRKARHILDTLIACGLGYLQLGQEMATLSGGEAQRIKLSAELAKRSTGNTLYLLDEPTTGLHFEDISKLLSVLHKLVDKGNTMIIIEHNLDVIKNADHIIDLGPHAGIEGGYLIAEGTPEQIALHPTSYTAKYLSKHIS
jgi:excinuclease ABC subunit A